MLRLILFIFGALAGVIAAIFFAPIPGKTFFNRMSKLPKEVKDIIDDLINISDTAIKLLSSVTEEVNDRVSHAVEVTKERSKEIKAELEKETAAK